MRCRGRLRGRKLKKQRRKIIILVISLFFILSVGYSAFQTVININVKGTINACTIGRTWEYDYTGSVQEFKAPCTGTYKLEVWGAQSGGWGYHNNFPGGYSVGSMNINKNDKLYVTTGGKGIDTNHYADGTGYNGGGIGLHGSSGGGATSITDYLIDDGQLKNYVNNKESVVMVAGGSGSNGHWSCDGKGYAVGGGFIGGNSGDCNGGSVNANYQTGGTQTSSGSEGNPGGFGYGGTGTGGGGAGYYGGSGSSGGSSIKQASGGGGSGYIGSSKLSDKAMYCLNCEESLDLTKPDIFTVATNGESSYRDTVNCPNGFSENPVSKCAKKGNGYARITLVSTNN